MFFEDASASSALRVGGEENGKDVPMTVESQKESTGRGGSWFAAGYCGFGLLAGMAGMGWTRKPTVTIGVVAALTLTALTAAFLMMAYYLASERLRSLSKEVEAQRKYAASLADAYWTLQHFPPTQAQVDAELRARARRMGEACRAIAAFFQAYPEVLAAAGGANMPLPDTLKREETNLQNRLEAAKRAFWDFHGILWRARQSSSHPLGYTLVNSWQKYDVPEESSS
ncbi:MAG: hypothetical protein IT406_03895 [Candidatus Yanofskybacteria bacterium]|nr:hypothetical protein [Candidatus Yanofskybacteria bacterium]